MRPLRHRWTALAAASALALLAACSPETGGDDEDGSAAADDGPDHGKVEGVENFYGEYGDYITVTAAIQDGKFAAEDLEHPFVVQQAHLDTLNTWDGANPVYELRPPAGGDHLAAWQTCTGSVYEAPLVDGNAVHSMEHGAVWLTYDPELVEQADIDALAEVVRKRDYSLMSPYPGQGVAVSLQSWGNRYQTEDPADANIDAYLDEYILNERFNPEPNAPCGGGLTTTAAEAGA